MRLDELNALDDEAARRELLRCCGSTAWATRMAAARPFSSVDRMLDTGDRFWNDCGAADWLEAFAAHPKIGAGQAGRAGLSDEARADDTRAKVDRAGETTEWSGEE